MTDEELDEARAEEATRTAKYFSDIAQIAARLGREGWTPVDPLVIEARQIVADFWGSGAFPRDVPKVLAGEYDGVGPVTMVLAALKRGMALASAQR